MPPLTFDVSEPLMQALLARSAQSGESVSHIVTSSLSEALESERATLFKFPRRALWSEGSSTAWAPSPS